MRRNIDLGTLLNKDKKFGLNLVIWGKFYDNIYDWQADLNRQEEVHKGGRLKIK